MVRQWDAMTGAAVGGPIRHDAPVTAVRFSPDGSKIATASLAGIGCLWEAATGRPIGGTAELHGEERRSHSIPTAVGLPPAATTAVSGSSIPLTAPC